VHETTVHVKLARFVLSTLLVLPLVVQAARGYRRQPDLPAWALHVPACWVTLGIYGRGWLCNRMAVSRASLDRTAWQQQ
jgi:hypothetical protein